MAPGVASSNRPQSIVPPVIVHSTPDYNARCEAGRLRRANLPYFLEVTREAKWEKVFCSPNWPLQAPWPYKYDPEYSKMVVYHIAAQNHIDVGSFVANWLPKLSNDSELIWNAIHQHPRTVFSSEELSIYGEPFLLKVYEWVRRGFELTGPGLIPMGGGENGNLTKIKSKSTTNSPVLRSIKHRKSKSHSMLSIEIPKISLFTSLTAKIKELDSSKSASVPPKPKDKGELVILGAPINAKKKQQDEIDPHVAWMEAEQTRRAVSQQESRKLPKRHGERSVSGPAPELPTGPKFNTSTGPRYFAPPASIPGQPIRTPHSLRMSTSQHSTHAMMAPKLVTAPRHDMPTVPQSAHVKHNTYHGVSVASGEMLRHPHQISEPIFFPGGFHPHLGHHYGSMGGPPPFHMSQMSMIALQPPNSPMNPMQPLLFDPAMAPQGSRPGRSQDPMMYGHAPQIRQYSQPAQSPYGSHRQFAIGPGRIITHGQEANSRHPRQQQQAYSGNGGSVRGRPRKQSTRNLSDNGRKNSLPPSIERPFPSNVDKSIPSGPTTAEYIPHVPLRASLSLHGNVKYTLPPNELERFPDFDARLAVNHNLPVEKQCHKKSIGLGVEDMLTLWVGNIPERTQDETLKELIEQLVPVKGLRHFEQEHTRNFCWTFVEFFKTSDARLVLEKLDGTILNGTPLDFRVPERFRCDIDPISRKYSTGKYSRQGPLQPGQIPSGPSRASFSRHNSMRKYCTNPTAHNDASGRRNSIFTPQDARSDLPELLEVQEGPIMPGVSMILEIIEVPKAPVVAEDPVISEVPKMPEAPQMSDTPQIAEILQIPEVSSITEHSKLAEDSSHPESSFEILEGPEILDSPKVATPKKNKKKKKKKASQEPTIDSAISVLEEESGTAHSELSISSALHPTAPAFVPAHVEVIESAAEPITFEFELALQATSNSLIAETSAHPIVDTHAQPIADTPTEPIVDTPAQPIFRRKAPPVEDSIHPFARAKVASAQRQASKSERKKVKKQTRAAKKTSESVALEPSELEVLSLDEIAAFSKSRPSSNNSPAATFESQLTEANVEALTTPNSATIPVQLKAESVTSSVTAVDPKQAMAAVAPKTRVPTAVAIPLSLSKNKRTVSVTVWTEEPHKERTASGVSVESDESSMVDTPKTAKEFQTPVPSPLSLSSPSAPEDSQIPLPKTVQEFEAPVSRPLVLPSSPPFEKSWKSRPKAAQEVEAPARSSLTFPATPTPKDSQKHKKKKSKKIKKKPSVDTTKQEESSKEQPQEEAPHSGIGFVGESWDTPFTQTNSATIQDDNKKSEKPRDMTCQDQKKTNEPKAKENTAIPKLSYAQMAAVKSPTTTTFLKEGLSLRNPNVSQPSK